MSRALKMIKDIRKSLDIYDTFTDKVSEIDHEVFSKANTIEHSGDTLLSGLYHKNYTANEIALCVEGYIIALEDEIERLTTKHY